MKTKPKFDKLHGFFKKIKKDWFAKTACLVVALMIYMFHQNTIFSRITFAVPLSVVANGEVVPVVNCPDFVRITVRAKTEHINMFNEETVTAVMDLNSYVDGGVHEVPVSLHLSPEIRAFETLEIYSRPDKVGILLDKKNEDYIEIEADVIGTPAAGYTLTGVTVTPSEVFVSGPESIMEKIQKIKIEKIDVTGASKSMRVTSPIVNENIFLKIDTESEISVFCTIEPTPLTRRFSNIPVAALNIPSGFVVEGSAGTVSFDLNGTELALSNYSPGRNMAYVDCANITAPGTHTLPVSFSLPKGMTVSKINADTVNVTVVSANVEDEIEEP